MGIVLSSAEIKLILRARTYKKRARIWAVIYIILAIIAASAMYFGYLGMNSGGFVLIFIMLNANENRRWVAQNVPTYDELLEFVERKISESAEAIEAINSAKRNA